MNEATDNMPELSVGEKVVVINSSAYHRYKTVGRVVKVTKQYVWIDGIGNEPKKYNVRTQLECGEKARSRDSVFYRFEMWTPELQAQIDKEDQDRNTIILMREFSNSVCRLSNEELLELYKLLPAEAIALASRKTRAAK